MTSESTNRNSAWDDYDLTADDFLTDPKSFSERIVAKAKEIEGELRSKNSLSNMEENFKAAAASNSDAIEKADAWIESVLDSLANLDAEVIANILPRLAEVTKAAHGIVRSSSMRGTRKHTKKRLHAMYVELRRKYSDYTKFMLLFEPNKYKFPMIPAIPGNFGDSVNTLKEYIFNIDGEPFLNPYTFGRLVGIQIEGYMDAVDAILNSDGTINNHAVSLTELN